MTDRVPVQEGAELYSASAQVASGVDRLGPPGVLVAEYLSINETHTERQLSRVEERLRRETDGAVRRRKAVYTEVAEK